MIFVIEDSDVMDSDFVSQAVTAENLLEESPQGSLGAVGRKGDARRCH